MFLAARALGPPAAPFLALNPTSGHLWCRVTMPRTQKLATLRTSSRPQQLQSSFLAPVAGLKGLCASFAREWGRALALGAWAVARGGAG